jgi:hypothetical protein
MPRIHEHAPACNSFLQHREPPPQRAEFLPAAPSSDAAFCLRAGADTSDIVATVTTSETADVATVTARHELNKPAEAAAATVEALMFSLRSGVNELTKPDTQRRLSELDERQLEAACLRIQAFKPEIAPAWSAEDVDLLISAWRKFREPR